MKRQFRRAPKGSAHQRHGPEYVRADQRAISRYRRPEVMPDHSGYGTIAKGRDQTQRVPDKVGEAKGIKVAVIRVVPPDGTSVATLIGSDHVISRCREREHDFPPRV